MTTTTSNRGMVLAAVLAVLLAAVAVSSTPYYNNYNGYNGYPSAYATPNKSHNLIIGNRQPGDRLVYQENIVKTSKWLQVVEVKKTFNVSDYYYLTQIAALDQKTNGNGAIATRLAGGPGFSNITLRFKSQRGHGINFVVQLYARSKY